MFRVDFSPAAETVAREVVPTDTILRVVEMLNAIGETAAEIDGGAGPRLGRADLSLSLNVDGFLFRYTLNVSRRSPDMMPHASYRNPLRNTP